MSLVRAFNAAESGIKTHQIKIDVIGNNLANVNTTGFKAGRALFQTIFSQTISFGSEATGNSGGINPKQVGLGVEVGQLSNNFTQGSLETTGIPSDLAIDGSGFFVLNDLKGSPVYSRDGAFSLNINNELVNAGNGFKVQGANADLNTFTVEAGGALEDIVIPIGLNLAKQTENVSLGGNFGSDGNPLPTQGSELSIPELYILGTTEEATVFTDLRAVTTTSGSLNPLVATSNGVGIGGGNVTAYTAGTSLQISAGLNIVSGTQYLLTVGKGPGVNQDFVFDGSAYTSGTGVIDLTDSSIAGDITAGAFSVAVTTDSVFSVQTQPTVGIQNGAVFTPLILTANKGGAELQNLEGVVTQNNEFTYNTTGTTVQDFMNFMERALGIDSSAGETVLSGGLTAGTTSTVTLDAETAGTFASLASSTDRFIFKAVSGTGTGQSFLFVPSTNYVAGTGVLTNPGSAAGIAFDNTTQFVIQRATTPHDGRFSEDEVVGGTKLTDFVTTAISANNTSVQVDTTVLAASIDSNLIHVGDVIRFEADSNDAQGKAAIITDINRATGVITFNVDGTANGLGLTDNIGALVTPPLGATFSILKPTGVNYSSDGVISVSGNQGTFNNITNLVIKDSDEAVKMTYAQDQDANGESGRSTFVVFDSTGNPKQVSVTFTLENRTDSTTIVRFIAESPNDTDLDASVTGGVAGANLSGNNGRIIGGGRVIFDSDGQQIDEEPDGSKTIAIDSTGQGAGADLTFDLDFSQLSALSGNTDINELGQDGLAFGTLTDFSVGTDGVVSGIFSNGAVRDVAQVLISRFANPQGLESLGGNTFREGPNSGPPLTGPPTSDGRGVIRSGALEASNVDLSTEFTDLITTQRGFQASARTITVSDELLQELLGLVR